MDKKEASRILKQEANKLRSRRYEELLDLLGSPKVYEIVASSGSKYQVEVQAFWDNPRQPGTDLRVIASIDDGGFLAALNPLSVDFIIPPGDANRPHV